jgi:predicted AlkP superfamily pyrophosphatase or phosphodiesterase
VFFPAVTSTVQASLRTAELPKVHGIVGNGFYSREFSKVFFWEQSSSLIEAERIWRNFRKKGKTVAQIFFQQSLGTDSDFIISPAPIHKHDGGIIQTCFSKPEELYLRLCKKLGRSFNLKNYWGPMANISSSKWITKATIEIMRTVTPDLFLVYLPHLDYELQKSGPYSHKSTKSFHELKPLLIELIHAAKEYNYNILIFGDYAMKQVNKTIFPNRILKEAGLFLTRNVKGMTYPNLYTSRAFAIVDHQVAHIIIKEKSDIPDVINIFKGVNGIKEILDEKGKENFGINHTRAGDIILIADVNAWFSYYWWKDLNEAPDYATHVDIHNKIGYDPCELFFSFWPPMSITTDTNKISGSHGIVDENSLCAFSSDLEFDKQPTSLVELANELKSILDKI